MKSNPWTHFLLSLSETSTAAFSGNDADVLILDCVAVVHPYLFSDPIVEKTRVFTRADSGATGRYFATGR